MLIRDWVWELIRDSFSEEEKATIRSAMTGETICPPGALVDEGKLPDLLAQRLNGALSVKRSPRGVPKEDFPW